MDDKTLNQMLDSLTPPALSPDLAARVIAKAGQMKQTPQAANDKGVLVKRLMAVAACLVAMVFAGTVLWSPATAPSEADDAAQWQIMADNTGFSDLYDWVYSEEETG